MKKHDEGYALPFVLVVLVVLCIIAVAIMDTSLRNLESQKTTIQRMQEKYAAAAKIEEICAAAESNATDVSFPSSEKALLFLVEGGELKVAAAGREDGEVWIIAKLIPKDNNGAITQTFGEQEKPDVLTINGSNTKTVRVTTYQVVDIETAKAFVKSGGAG